MQLSSELGVLCAYCLFESLKERAQLSSELGVLCAYCLIDLLGEGVQLSSELDVLCAYCLFDLLGKVTIHFPLFCGVKSIISLLA